MLVLFAFFALFEAIVLLTLDLGTDDEDSPEEHTFRYDSLRIAPPLSIFTCVSDQRVVSMPSCDSAAGQQCLFDLLLRKNETVRAGTAIKYRLSMLPHRPIRKFSRPLPGTPVAPQKL